jgi:3-oxoacyl-[acyl-carrier-protein] synthase-3
MAIPPRVQTAAELAPLIHRSAEWIQQHTGVLRRRVAGDDVSPAQLAASAAREAISHSGPPDLILYAGALTQQLVPDTSAFVQHELELERIPCFTINQTCLSFIAALQVAHGLLKVGSYKRILICSGELATRGRSFEEAESAALLGDGAAAAVVEYSDECESDLIHCSLETWSDGIELCSVRAGNHPPPRPDMSHDALFCFHMLGPQLFRFVRPRLKRFLKSFLESAGTSIDQVQLVVPHQASGPGLRLLEQAGFPSDRIVNIVADYGNCVAASIPMALAVAVQEGRIARGDCVLLVGTAAGVSLGAALLRW